ncbi:hypothetical protein J2810_002350 [Chryseobacterium rhizosphaerae]|uniref:hypothetical protein n=1 Tax=Chryseobacterium rhizosphaerae TaxID=395937 RepID=UPI0028593C24|nr:hypothetical protein [Chryseobacterium rhizosphaerae]MDR6546294.1 hypothetical protein [Chryseobacterium rhizosphaerae]
MLKKIVEETEPEDLIWNHPKAISLNFREALRKTEGKKNPSYMLPQKTDLQIVEFDDLDFSGVTVSQNVGLLKRYFGYKRINLGPVYFFPYISGTPKDDFSNVGRLENIPLYPTLAEPQYVITGEMNGCAIIITKKDGAKTFTAWHFQSPDSVNNREKLRAFLKEYRNEIYSYLCFSDYASENNDETYNEKEREGFNYLFFNRKNHGDGNDWVAGTWELRCIPLIRTLNNPKQDDPWVGDLISFSTKNKFTRPIDFNQPLIPANETGDLIINWIISHITYDVTLRNRPVLPPLPAGVSTLPPVSIINDH